jgi:hypothetical protein
MIKQEAPGILCTSNADCVGSPYCAGLDDCCCVSYTYSYCGVPTDCNPYLQCLPDDIPEPVVPAPFSVGAADNAFELLSRVSTCLAEDEDDDEEMDDDDDSSEDSDSSSSSDSATGKSEKKRGGAGAKESKKTKKRGKRV